MIHFADKVREAMLVRLDEEPVERADILDGHDIRVNLGPSGICTLRVKIS